MPLAVQHPSALGVVPVERNIVPLDPIDQLQTISGDDWTPALVDERGRMVLAQSKTHSNVLVLADPDLLNNQGLAKLDNARAGMAILNTLRGEGGVTFDVTLNGFSLTLTAKGAWQNLPAKESAIG